MIYFVICFMLWAIATIALLKFVHNATKDNDEY